MKVVIALALASALMVGCSDSSTEPTTSNDGGNGSAGSGSTDTSGSDTSGSNDTSGSGDSGSTDTSSSGDSGSTDTSGSDDSGSTDTSSSGDNGSTDTSGSGDSGTVAASCTSTDVGIAFQAINATVISDADAAPSELIDGCVDRAHSWSGDYGSIVTLDAGSVHQMQGVYIWSTFARMEILKIESSANGIDWVTEMHLVPTKPVAGPVYYPLAEAGGKRYVRVTGFGSELNEWTNLAEIRWSLTGYSVSGDRVIRNTTAKDYEGLSHSRHLLLEWTGIQAQHAASMRGQCPFGEEFSAVDVTGSQDEFMTNKLINGRKVYLFDWDHYPYRHTPNPDMFDYVLEPHNDYLTYLTAQPEYLALENPENCSSSGLGDALYSSATLVQELVQGIQQPNNNNWQ